MRSPSEMDVVQIEVTNACVHSCSNCTRFCGHHVKTFVMDPAFFRKAVDSMRGFSHCLGVMGGEPTLHPNFRELCEYVRNEFPQNKPTRVFTGPGREFVKEVDENNLRLKKDTIRGLFSSLGASYYRHFEIIQDTFGFQCLNDHLNPGHHGALMITRKELGIPDAEWVALRDNCWVQNLWSASITPKGAFFCEIAASLDMLLGGPGGWAVEPGWWEREPKDFGEQLQWCELCSAALAVPKRDSRDEKDDISPWWGEKLAALSSPKLSRGGTILFDIDGYSPGQFAVTNHHRPYLDDKNLRMSSLNRTIYPDSIVVLTGDARVSNHGGQAGVTRDWILYAKDSFPNDIPETVRGLVFNPGCFYHDPSLGISFFNLGALSLDGFDGSVADARGLYPDHKVVKTDFAAL